MMLESLLNKGKIKTENFSVIESNLIEKIRADFIEAIDSHQIDVEDKQIISARL